LNCYIMHLPSTMIHLSLVAKMIHSVVMVTLFGCYDDKHVSI